MRRRSFVIASMYKVHPAAMSCALALYLDIV